MNNNFSKLGFLPTDILLPQVKDMKKWSVVACDQYTSQPEYWENADSFVGDAPSALRLILPESELKSDGVEKKIEKINATMDTYLKNGVFKNIENSFILVERKLRNGSVRTGLVGAVDLEDYDYNKGASSLIRATEGTVLERIPPRVRVREGASLELPHVMLLIDDPDCTVIEKAAATKKESDKVYDFDMMADSGHIKGYRISGEDADNIADALTSLAEPESFNRKYSVSGKPVLLYAVGDGNHSLATAKTCWENIKKTLKDKTAYHPARYALVELVNIHDKSLQFEPIHRAVFSVDPEKIIEALLKFYPNAKLGEGNGQRIEFVSAKNNGVITVENPESGLAVGTLQNFLNAYIKENGGSVDYIHGKDVVINLGKKENSIGFILPPMGKSELFRTVITDGVLPRKTFSMGEACDKRFYLEARKIK